MPTALPQFAWVLVLEGKGSLGDGMKECNGSKRFVRQSTDCMREEQLNRMLDHSLQAKVAIVTGHLQVKSGL